MTFAPADVRVRSRWGLCELLERLGTTEVRRVYPDFAQVARYAWLAGDRRLQEIGIKTYQQRGEGTDFKQLSEYRVGDSVRHIDWRATLRLGKPIVREFQDERDQCVLLLVDCGRRMRADDRQGAIGTTHFDQVLNAVMLLTYVALKQGDAVGAMTFGTPAGEERSFAPRKGAHALNALMGAAVRRAADAHPFRLRDRGAGCCCAGSAGARSSSSSPISATRTAPSCATRSACCARAIWCCSRACASGSSAS